MDSLELGFWLCAACVLYAYAGYPLLLALLGKIVGRRTMARGALPQSVTIILAAHNEEATMDRRLTELTELLAGVPVQGEILLVSDGSTDGTVAVARRHGDPVRVLAFAERRGKAVALSEAAARARGAILVFADARQVWDREALRRLLENFIDPGVGAVSGDLVLQSADGILAGVGLYWRYEKWLRRQESRLHSMIGATGAISAVRRELFRPIPAGTLIDDVYWPLQVALQGYRVVHEARSRAYDRLPPTVQGEFRRKVRTLSGNYQLLTRLPAALLPWRNPIWLQFVSHKLLRLVVPWALLALLASSAALAGSLYRVVFVAQVLFYLVALAGLSGEASRRSRLVSAASSFLVLNAAAWLAFWVWFTGRTGSTWNKIDYQARPLPRPEAT
jgi:biofilm PGA synthesis N-glycosyltransferase PgaC